MKMPEMKLRHWKRVIASPEFVAFGFPVVPNRRFECVSNPIPADAKIVRSGYDADRDLFYCVVEHPSFPEVREGELIPFAPAAQYTVHTYEN